MDSQYRFQAAQQAYLAHINCSCVITGHWCGDVNRGSDPAFPICVWAMGEYMRGQAQGIAARYGLEPVAAQPAPRVEIDLTQDEPAEATGSTAARAPEYIDLTQDSEQEEDEVVVTSSRELVTTSSTPGEVNAPLTPEPAVPEPPKRKYGKGKREWLLRRSTIEVTRVTNGNKVHYAANGSVASQSELAAMYEVQQQPEPQNETEGLEELFQAMTQPAPTQLVSTQPEPTTPEPTTPAPALAEPTLPSPQGSTDGKKRKASISSVDSDAGPSKCQRRSSSPAEREELVIVDDEGDRQANDDQKHARLMEALAEFAEQEKREAKKIRDQKRAKIMAQLAKLKEQKEGETEASEDENDGYSSSEVSEEE